MALHLAVGEAFAGPDRGKARFLEQAEKVFLGHGPGQTFSPQDVVIFQGRRGVGVADHIGDNQPAAGPQHPVDFGKGSAFMGREINDAVGEHHVDGSLTPGAGLPDSRI